MVKVLSEDLKYWRPERPDEWTMDEFIRKAAKLEDALLECCNELEAYLHAEYPEYARKYEHNERSYQAEMDDITARRLLAKGN